MKLKFMGTADVKEVRKGDTFGDVLTEPLPVDVVWDQSNGWIVDTGEDKYADIPDEAWEYLVVNDNFKDVSAFVRVPLNDNQKTFLALREGDQKTLAEEEEARLATLDSAFEAARQEAAAANQREEVLAKIRNADASYDQLMEYAKEHNVKGRSKMDKEELQEAITDVVRNSTDSTESSASPARTSSTVSGAGGTATGGSTTGGTGGGKTTTAGGSTAKTS